MNQDETNSQIYNGIEELELLDAADNYTFSIINRIKGFFSSTGKTLDFGAGAGTYAKRLVQNDFPVECVEIDPTLTQILKDNDLQVHNGLPGIEEKSIDQIYSINVLEHIEDDIQTLKGFHKILKDGGRLYLYLPAFPILYSRFDKKIGHFRRYKKDDLSEKLDKAGFEIKSISYRDSIGFFVALLFRITVNSDSVSKKSVGIYDKLIFPFSKILDPILGIFFGKNIEAMVIKK